MKRAKFRRWSNTRNDQISNLRRFLKVIQFVRLMNPTFSAGFHKATLDRKFLFWQKTRSKERPTSLPFWRSVITDARPPCFLKGLLSIPCVRLLGNK